MGKHFLCLRGMALSLMLLLFSSTSFASNIECAISLTSNWGSGSQFSIKVTNLTDQPIEEWSLDLSFPSGTEIFNSWKVNQDGTNPTTFSSLNGNVLQPGEWTEYYFGFQVNHNGNPYTFPELNRCGEDGEIAYDDDIFHIGANRTYGTTNTEFILSPNDFSGDFPSAGTSYLWEISDDRVVTTENALLSFTEPGIYTAQLTLTNSGGAKATNAIALYVHGIGTNAPADLLVPDVYGDTNGDAVFDLRDVHLAAKFEENLAFIEPGIRQAAADLNFDGKVTQADIALMSQGLLAGQPLPDTLLIDDIIGENVMPGSFVSLVSPELLNADDLIEIQVGDSDRQSVIRPVLGYVTFIVPNDLDTSGADANTLVKLYKNDSIAAQYQLEVIPLPSLPSDPVAEVKSLFAQMKSLLQVNSQLIEEQIDEQSLSQADSDLLTAWANAGIAETVDSLDAMEALLDGQGGELLAELFLSSALANGLETYENQLQSFLSANAPAAPMTSVSAFALISPDEVCDNLLPAICALKQAAKVVDTTSSIVSYTCDALLAVALAAVAFPGDGPVLDAATLFAWASACGVAEASIDVTAVFITLISDVDADARFNIENQNPTPSNPAVLIPEIEVFGTDDICTLGINGGYDKIKEKISKLAVERLIKRKITFRAMSNIAERLGEKALENFKGLLEAAAGEAVDLSDLNGVVGRFSEPYCDRLLGADLIMNASRVITGPEPNEGTLNVLSDGTGEYFCSEDPATSSSAVINFTLNKTVCETPVSITRTVNCGSQDVTITMGDNGSLNDDIFEVQVNGVTVLTSSSPVRSTTVTIQLPIGSTNSVVMLGRAAPDGVGTYFINISGGNVTGDAQSGSDLTPGTQKAFTLTIPE